MNNIGANIFSKLYAPFASPGNILDATCLQIELYLRASIQVRFVNGLHGLRELTIARDNMHAEIYKTLIIK